MALLLTLDAGRGTALCSFGGTPSFCSPDVKIVSVSVPLLEERARSSLFPNSTNEKSKPDNLNDPCVGSRSLEVVAAAPAVGPGGSTRPDVDDTEVMEVGHEEDLFLKKKLNSSSSASSTISLFVVPLKCEFTICVAFLLVLKTAPAP